MENSKENLVDLTRLILAGEERFYIKAIRKIIVGADPAEFSELIVASDNYMFQSLLYYMQLFRDEPQIKEIVNDPGFRIEALERIIIHFHQTCLLQGRSIEKIFTDYFPLLEQEQYFRLLTETKYITRDMLISFNIMTQLDKEYLDQFFRQLTDAVDYINGIIVGISEELTREFFCENPELYDYFKLYIKKDLEENSAMHQYYESHNDYISESNELIRIGQRIMFFDEKIFLEDGKRNPERIIAIINEIKKKGSVKRTLQYLEKHRVYYDDTERLIVQNILANPYFKDILDSLSPIMFDDLEGLSKRDLLFFDREAYEET